MKRFSIKLLTGVLTLSLLAGCGGKTVPSAVDPDSAADPEDLVYQIIGVGRDETLLTIDGAPVKAETYLFWLANSIETMKQYGMLADDAAWEESYGDGTMADAAKADALETTKLYQVMENKAAERGVTLTQEQEDEVNEQIESIIEQSGGEEEFLAQLEAMCISKEGFMALNRVYYLNLGVEEKLEAAGELSATDAEVEDYITENGIYAAKHILLSTRRQLEDGTYEDFSDEEKAQVLTQAQELRKQLSDAGDSEELFDELMNQYSEDGRDGDGNLYAPDGYTLVYENQMVPEFEEGAKALKEGEVSDPIQTSYGYHIILRIPVDRAEARKDCEGDAKFGQMTQQWMDEAEIVTTEAYDNLDPKAFYEKLQELIAARMADSAKPEESPVG